MVFFKELSTSLKQKWLEYYQKNYSWLILHMTEQNTVQTPDGGRRPLSYLILGILNALEPELEALMLPFSKLKADADSLVEVLGLNFDPDIAIGKKPGFSSDISTPMDMDIDKTGEDTKHLPGGNQPLMPDTIEDSNDLGIAAAAAITGAVAVAEGVALAAGLDQDLDDLPDNDQNESNLELESGDSLAMELDSGSEVDDGLDLGTELVADGLDMELGSDSQVNDELEMELDSDSQVNNDLPSIDLGDLNENSSGNIDQVEDISESFENIDDSELGKLDDDVNLFGQDSLDKIVDIDLSELGDSNQSDDVSSNDLEDLDFDLDGEELDLSLDEADLDSLVGDQKSSNDDDLEGLLG
ncbi:MAG: DUF5331 domain-containing protein [Trichodesmium sp. MAG_R04]|nr:DUF5331 domain-containing protein [Trichodesmium sp. MAG_R04]